MRSLPKAAVAASFLMIILTGCKTAQQESEVAGAAPALPPNKRDIRIISDIDDTVKVTNVEDKLSEYYNGLFGKAIFAGTSELYRALLSRSTASQTTGDKNLIFLSGAPGFLQKKLMALLKDKGFPEASFYVRTNWPKPSTETHKRQALPAIVNGFREGGFVLLGDDTEFDPEIYADFIRTPAGAQRVYAIYIRRINGREIPANVVPYYTTFDVAAAEFRAGRLTAEQAIDVANAVLAAGQDEPQRLFPDYAFCPTNLRYPGISNDPLADVKQKVATFVNAFCAKRPNGSWHERAYEKLLEILPVR